MYENLFRHSLIKQKDVETKSFSSHDSFKEKHALMVKDLYSNVSKQLKKNEQKLLQIIKDNPHFNLDLYRPSILNKGQSKENLNSQLLEKQLDRLIEDQCRLDKQLSKIEFKNQQVQFLKQIQTNQRINHFSFLRNIWHRSDKQIFSHSEDQLEQLNRKVVMVKRSIKSLKQKEKQKSPDSIQLQKWIEQSKQFMQLKQKYQKLAEQCQNKQEEYHMQIQLLEAKILQLRQENCNIWRRFGEETEKIKKKDDQLVKIMDKYQALEIQILRKQKQLKRFTQNTNTNEVSMKSLSNLHPETNNKKLTFLNKTQDFSLYIVLQSDTMSAEINNFSSSILCTTRNLSEIKNYLTSNNILQGLIQNKYVTKISSNHTTLTNNISTTFLKSNLSNTLEKRMDSRRINNFERPQTLCSENLLGSADKRKRFERTKTIENQDLT